MLVFIGRRYSKEARLTQRNLDKGNLLQEFLESARMVAIKVLFIVWKPVERLEKSLSSSCQDSCLERLAATQVLIGDCAAQETTKLPGLETVVNK